MRRNIDEKKLKIISKIYFYSKQLGNENKTLWDLRNIFDKEGLLEAYANHSLSYIAYTYKHRMERKEVHVKIRTARKALKEDLISRYIFDRILTYENKLVD